MSVRNVLNHILTGLFNPNQEMVIEMSLEIYKDQNTLTGSPNFFYRGKTHIYDREYNVHKLREELITKYLNYAAAKEQLDKDRAILTAYFSSLGRKVKNKSDLYFLLPSQLHANLREYPVTESDTPSEAVEELIPSNFDEIRLVVIDQLMFSIIN